MAMRNKGGSTVVLHSDSASWKHFDSSSPHSSQRETANSRSPGGLAEDQEPK